MLPQDTLPPYRFHEWLDQLRDPELLAVQKLLAGRLRVLPTGEVFGARGHRVGWHSKDGHVIYAIHDYAADPPRQFTLYLHRLVYAAYIGPIPVEMVVHHRNCLSWDNRVENLELVTLDRNRRLPRLYPYLQRPAPPPITRVPGRVRVSQAQRWRERRDARGLAYRFMGYLDRIAGNDRLGIARLIDGRWTLFPDGTLLGGRGQRIGRAHPDGYMVTSIGQRRAGKKHLAMVRIHRLVYLAFVGPIPPDCVINHMDFDRGNNRVENLEAVTQKANVHHAIAAGRTPPPRRYYGSQHRNARLTEQDVIEMRRLHGEGWSGRGLAKRFGCTPSNVSQILKRKGWQHV